MIVFLCENSMESSNKFDCAGFGLMSFIDLIEIKIILIYVYLYFYLFIQCYLVNPKPLNGLNLWNSIKVWLDLQFTHAFG